MRRKVWGAWAGKPVDQGQSRPKMPFVVALTRGREIEVSGAPQWQRFAFPTWIATACKHR